MYANDIFRALSHMFPDLILFVWEFPNRFQTCSNHEPAWLRGCFICGKPQVYKPISREIGYPASTYIQLLAKRTVDNFYVQNIPKIGPCQKHIIFTSLSPMSGFLTDSCAPHSPSLCQILYLFKCYFPSKSMFISMIVPRLPNS